ncbi:MAG TPA: potassium transporter TrkA [Actinomycetota bacterium]|jgi:hypothetical protein
MTPKPSLRARIRYRFDNLLASGTRSLVVWLAIATISLIIVASVIEAIIGIRVDGQRVSFVEALWLALLRTLDPGTMGGDVGWAFRLISLFVTLGGVLIVSSLIALMAEGISRRAMELGRGKTVVAETGHTLILGWSPKVFTIIEELVVANGNQRNASIVLLAPLDKAEMEQQLKSRVPNRGSTRLILRTGTPYELVDLNIVNPESAKSIIVVRPEDDDGDPFVVKTVLALLSSDRLRPDLPCVAEVADDATADSLRQVVSGRLVEVVESHDLMARMTAQVCRQPGLSAAYQELLDFDGDEIYFQNEPLIVGMTFGEALMCYEDSSLLGLRFADGRVVVNPPMDTVISEGDQVVAVAEDDDKVRCTGKVEYRAPALGNGNGARPRNPERLLMLGWNELAPTMIRELDHYVAPGSEVVVLADGNPIAQHQHVLDGLRNVSLELRPSPEDEVLQAELMGGRPVDHLVMLCDRRQGTEATVDTRALLNLLQVRQWMEGTGHRVNVVLELLDERDVSLVPPSSMEEFIVSERFTSLLMAQLSENIHVGKVFEDLLDEEGSELYLKPAALYAPPSEVAFGEIVAAARDRGEVALGYRLASSNGRLGGVALNPRKSSRVTLGPEDSVVVVAQGQ